MGAFFFISILNQDDVGVWVAGCKIKIKSIKKGYVQKYCHVFALSCY